MVDLRIWYSLGLAEESKQISFEILQYMPFKEVFFEGLILPEDFWQFVNYINPSRGINYNKLVEYIEGRAPESEKQLVLLKEPYFGNTVFLDGSVGKEIGIGSARCTLNDDKVKNGNVAVVSLFKAGNRKIPRGTNVALHELGELFGFGHCDDSNCFMYGPQQKRHFLNEWVVEAFMIELDGQTRFCKRDLEKIKLVFSE